MKVLDQIILIPGVLYDSNCYIIGQEKLVMIDCGTGYNMDHTLSQIKSSGLNPENISNIILTHVHFDHCGGLNRMPESPETKINVFDLEAPFIEAADGRMLLLDMFNAYFKPLKVDVKLKDGQIIHAGPYSFKVIHTPGHTLGSICLYEEENRLLISGDTVFSGGSFGRVDLPSGSISQLCDSMKKLSELDIRYILPGHMDISLQGNKDIKAVCNLLKDY